ncbi:HD domain-containing protein [Mucilaginibacter sp. HC2]|jgi:predicted metal-dependent HD superfamily phosphohydrolase|uniref:HD domain-containing protein n=1 Tax=Mucilaginibacter TaxID=423349 RepID=UPI000DCBF7A4|nr:MULTISPECIES: HD domain-containing protein [Mucilaginibacter]NHA05618.1 HD domain-containing protein [Mucilaginibacter inviolabilis]QTE35421.1 HD domain-containing protein [Mucilaginibacter gossypii]RAV59376.1 hypothetical protein DIU36_05990 [Mucilaginibacter rubeus]
MNIVARSERFVRKFISENLPNNIYFHNEIHAQDVAEAVKEIGRVSAVTHEDIVVLEVAGWFHDTGYCFEYDGHENSSINIADGFLSSEACSRDFVEKVIKCIRSTRFPQQPNGLLEQIICDADLYHLSKKNYNDYAVRLRAEWSSILLKGLLIGIGIYRILG